MILIIEDHPVEQKLMREVLVTAGYEVRSATDGEQAIAMIAAERFRLILVDMTLPGIDGLALVRRLKEDPNIQDIPVVAVTSFPEKYTKTEVLAAGCDAFLVKPVSTRTLPDFMQKMLALGPIGQPES